MPQMTQCIAMMEDEDEEDQEAASDAAFGPSAIKAVRTVFKGKVCQI